MLTVRSLALRCHFLDAGVFETFTNNYHNSAQKARITQSRSHTLHTHRALLPTVAEKKISEMLGQDGIKVALWSLSRTQRFVEYVKPGYSETMDGKSMERYIEVPLEYDAFEILFSAHSLVLSDEEGVQVSVTWENQLRAIKFMDKATIKAQEWLSKNDFSHWRPEKDCWVKAGVFMQASTLEPTRLASGLGKIEIKVQIGRQESMDTAHPKYDEDRALALSLKGAGITHHIELNAAIAANEGVNACSATVASSSSVSGARLVLQESLDTTEKLDDNASSQDDVFDHNDRSERRKSSSHRKVAEGRRDSCPRAAKRMRIDYAESEMDKESTDEEGDEGYEGAEGYGADTSYEGAEGFEAGGFY
ncbi:hypothetical protein FKW77_001762, partial [Venturia effusa]